MFWRRGRWCLVLTDGLVTAWRKRRETVENSRENTWMVSQLPCSFGKCGTIFMIFHDELYFVAILLGTMWEYYDQAWDAGDSMASLLNLFFSWGKPGDEDQPLDFGMSSTEIWQKGQFHPQKSGSECIDMCNKRDSNCFWWVGYFLGLWNGWRAGIKPAWVYKHL